MDRGDRVRNIRRAEIQRRASRRQKRRNAAVAFLDSDDSGGNPGSGEDSNAENSEDDHVAPAPKRSQRDDNLHVHLTDVSNDAESENSGSDQDSDARNDSDENPCRETNSGPEDHAQDGQDIAPPIIENHSEEDGIGREPDGLRLGFEPEDSSHDDSTSVADDSSGDDIQSEASDLRSEESDMSDIDAEDELNQALLYDGAQLTLRESLLNTLSFALKHQLTGSAISDLLGLTALHCKADSRCLKTLYKFKQYFSVFGNSKVERRYYCSVCEISLEGKDDSCEACNGRNPVSYFIEFSLKQQLQSMFLRPGFYESLTFRSVRVKKHASNFEDIYDSKIYKQFVDEGFLKERNNISFFMYFEGVSLFKSSKFSLWPVYLTINELNYKQRTQKENVVLASMWFGKAKPNPNLFLKHLQQQLYMLQTVGVNLNLPDDRERVLIRCKVIGAVGDMPAKSRLRKRFNFIS